MDEIENEKHFLINCSKYTSDRQNLLDSINSLCPNFTNLGDSDKFYFLMSAEGKICQNVAKFCYNANQTRKNSLNSE